LSFILCYDCHLNDEYDIGNHFFNILHYRNIAVYIHVKNCKAIPGQSWSDPEVSRQSVSKGGKLSALLTG